MMKEWFKARNVWGAVLSALPDEDAGRLAKAIWTYTMTGEVTDLEGASKGIFAMILMVLQQDEEHDSKVSMARSIAGSTRHGKANDSNSEQLPANDSNCNQMPANDNNCDNKNKNKRKSKNKEKEEDILLHFEMFWSAYPRHEGKQNALRAFEKINPDEEMLSVMLKAIEKQKKSSQWQECGGQYIPHPATWLNGKRWEDEVQTGQPQKIMVAQSYTQRDYTGEDEDALRRMLTLEEVSV